MTTDLTNSPPVCSTCHGNLFMGSDEPTIATCMRQVKDSPFEWEWHCDRCCTHLMEGDDPACVPAGDVPAFYSSVDLNTWRLRLERDEALRLLQRYTGRDFADELEARAGLELMTETCLGCNGTGKLSRWVRFFKRTCRRCDGLGEITVPL